ncbi:MAG: phage scaffolding protein [Youngiibacter sp.]|nr:phage scaffolding protein [Youngiibacter sp.]
MEFLKALFADKALTFDELKTAVEAASDKYKIINLKDGGYVDKDKFTTKETEISTLKDQLKTANDQIAGFKGMDIDGIKAAADKYKSDYEAAEAKHKSDLEKLTFDFALDKALTGAKAKNAKAVKALIDVNALKLNGDEIAGLKEQLEKVTTEAPYLFDIEETDPEEPPIKITKGGGTGGKGNKNPWSKEHWNLTEQGAILKADPQRARALKAQAGK